MHLKYFFKYGISIFGIFFVDRRISKLHSYYKGIQHIVSHLSYIIFNGTNSYVSCAWMPKCRQAYNGRFLPLDDISIVTVILIHCHDIRFAKGSHSDIFI